LRKFFVTLMLFFATLTFTASLSATEATVDQPATHEIVITDDALDDLFAGRDPVDVLDTGDGYVVVYDDGTWQFFPKE